MNSGITINAQTIITLSAVLAAIAAIVKYYNRGYDFAKHQQEQDEEIAKLKEDHVADMKNVKQEQTLITYGVLACLKGLREQGCNGAVTDAIDKFEKFLNKAAHGQQ